MEGMNRWEMCLFWEVLCLFLSLRGNTFGDVLLLDYIRALWRVLYTMYCICKRNKQVHAGTKPRSVLRAQLFIDKGSTSDICAGLCSSFSHNIKQTEQDQPLRNRWRCIPQGLRCDETSGAACSISSQSSESNNSPLAQDTAVRNGQPAAVKLGGESKRQTLTLGN